MSKYGFNENEIRRSVVDMVDKDGFHKEFVVDGKYQPDESEGFAIDYYFDEYGTVAVLMVNIPVDLDLSFEEANNHVYSLLSDTDIDWVRNVGDSIGEHPYDDVTWSHPFLYFPSLNAAAEVLFSVEFGEIKYYQVYIVDDNFKVIDRKKLEIYRLSMANSEEKQ